MQLLPKPYPSCRLHHTWTGPYFL